MHPDHLAVVARFFDARTAYFLALDRVIDKCTSEYELLRQKIDSYGGRADRYGLRKEYERRLRDVDGRLCLLMLARARMEA